MAPKRKPLTKEQYDLLGVKAGWELVEVDKEHWRKIPGIQRLDDTVAIMASGCIDDTRVLNDIHAIAGFDVLVHETRPQPNEPEGNAYHYVVQELRRSDYPYVLHGPFRSQTRVAHWYGAEDLAIYWESADG